MPLAPLSIAPARSAQGKTLRQTGIVLCAGVLLGLGAVIAARLMLDPSPKGPVAVPGDSRVYSGSILFKSEQGTMCRQLTFDNASGQFTDKGKVDCDQAAYRGLDQEAQSPADRVRVISNGFRGR